MTQLRRLIWATQCKTYQVFISETFLLNIFRPQLTPENLQNEATQVASAKSTAKSRTCVLSLSISCTNQYLEMSNAYNNCTASHYQVESARICLRTTDRMLSFLPMNMFLLV